MQHCCHDDSHQPSVISRPNASPVTDHHSHDGHNHADQHDHGAGWKQQAGLLCSLLMLLVLLVMEYGFNLELPSPYALIVNIVAYLLAGWGVLRLAFRKAMRGDFFNEFVLMSMATLGAFYIGEYTEGVAVMVFYSIGEWFQESAVNRAKAGIKALLDSRPDQVSVLRKGKVEVVHSAGVQPGETIRIKPGEKVALDGRLLSEHSTFNTAALTGESVPDTRYKGDTVLAGMINLQTVADVEVTVLFKDSKLSRILEMVQDATARKSQTQLFISRFARIYTPIVFFLALALVLVPFFIVDEYRFNDWLYRALVFLVISCPCALVISIPLGYFGGIGLASRKGILFKGGNFLDVMTQVDTVVMDKTGTLTKGVFRVQDVASTIDQVQLIRYAAALESHSTHPAGKAIVEYAANVPDRAEATSVEELAGHGLRGMINGQEVLAGNLKLLKKYGVSYAPELETRTETIVAVAINHHYAGYFTIADELKDDAAATIRQLQQLKIRPVMLSGDKQAVVDKVARTLGIEKAWGDLLPEGKVEKLEALKKEGRKIAFAGDGINDAPVLALADAGIAMGGLGSDAAIETADIVIQNDQVQKIVTAIRIGQLTRQVVWQNIVLAMAVKIAVLSLGAFGVANLWEAVIADVGVALLAILNAVRIQQAKLSAE